MKDWEKIQYILTKVSEQYNVDWRRLTKKHLLPTKVREAKHVALGLLSIHLGVDFAADLLKVSRASAHVCRMRISSSYGGAVAALVMTVDYKIKSHELGYKG